MFAGGAFGGAVDRNGFHCRLLNPYRKTRFDKVGAEVLAHFKLNGSDFDMLQNFIGQITQATILSLYVTIRVDNRSRVLDKIDFEGSLLKRTLLSPTCGNGFLEKVDATRKIQQQGAHHHVKFEEGHEGGLSATVDQPFGVLGPYSWRVFKSM